ncbi:MAG: hypothetical protein ABT03_15065 [Comamonas sp. SCN 67-35]|uniref:DUF2147 domain-containing protein n=1 Tax=unclassified Comamonas TaxID=2638500 RepID=UPI00086AD386|nr:MULTISPECIES: DUF2147 domain-containing protein [unclassified Comamonas]MBN9331651.1 DUF2147 domain-containing protein [Comamonas sp.]ODU36825.1 MAG: hypothetical protein ABT03_15065 [Comamonas sp. SCN 67-35]OJW99972.1 MAG: hypothetical protein BGO73_08025 [Burkholderiales bacterium 66-26]
MRQALAALFVTALSFPAWAQMTPLGTWNSIDDKTGQPKAEIQIVDKDGALSGRVIKSLQPSSEPLCTECTDDRKDQPKIGMEIIRGGKQAEGGEVWEGGRILDPDNGKDYRATFTPIDGGKQLQVRGFIGPFFRTQVWKRVQ